MVNKCSFEATLHKTWFLWGPAVSWPCCRWFEKQLQTNTLMASMASFINTWCNAVGSEWSYVPAFLGFSLCLWLSNCQIVLLIDHSGSKHFRHGPLNNQQLQCSSFQYNPKLNLILCHNHCCKCIWVQHAQFRPKSYQLTWNTLLPYKSELCVTSDYGACRAVSVQHVLRKVMKTFKKT